VKIPGMHRPAAGDVTKSLTPQLQEELSEPLAALDDALEREDYAAARAQLPLLEPSLKGDRMFQELEGGLAPEAYWRQAAWRRIAAIAAGPAANVVAAFALFVALLMVGPLVPSTTVHQALAGRPAVAAGVLPGDRIVSVAGRKVTAGTIPAVINATHGKPFRLVVERNHRLVTLGPLAAKRNGGRWMIGVEMGVASGPGKPFGAAVAQSGRLTWQVSRDTVSAIAGLAHGQGTQNVSSTVGIVQTTSQAYQTSLRDYFGVLGFISLSLALANLLPLLPLDGGHIVMTILETVRRRAFSQLAYLRYSIVGLALLLFVFMIGLNNDLPKLHS